ncbi:tRNA ligase [Xylaria sp. CBS 124048]|nr:tRNA ligase [Xylaria sp. CBS 124048]
MDLSNSPYAAPDPQKVTQVVNVLKDMTSGKSKQGRSKKTSYKVAGSPDKIVVDSWRLREWDYKRPDLPTYARGLFTTKNRSGQHEIAVRGYDKFFNVNEVAKTKWNYIKENTRGPYELTLKENGCIIFISGLEDGTLLICSKHSTGDRSDTEVSHANAGEKWVDKQLATIGKTREEFSRELRRRNVTAVAELCDDDFEEHILPYGPEKAGLYLHGINLNIPEFMTYSSNLVQQFADEWGFRKIGVQYYDDVDTVRKFLEEVAESGAHEGRDVEGFVVRCKISSPSGQYDDWFFKYKFEEPYLLYRQWRECTKAVIASSTPKINKHVKITREYLAYARQRLASDPNLGKLYLQNHGIIALRDDFLAFKNIKGSDAANIENTAGDEGASSVSGDVVLVPIATIGCGKTTVGVALSHLFGWGIVQNDNIQGKNRPAKMVEAVTGLLKEHPVVIADRNNSERRERHQIIQDINAQRQGARLVALNFTHGNMDDVKKITTERVLKRGDNHQTIQAASDQNKVIGIMENFLARFQPCDPENGPDHDFDLIIDLDPTLTSRANVEKVVSELHKRYPLLIPSMPSAEDMDAAVKTAIEEYSPSIRQAIPDRSSNPDSKRQGTQKPPGSKKEKARPLEYMSVSVLSKDIQVALESAFKDADSETQKFYKELQQSGRVQSLFHVTLIHRSASGENPELWSRYQNLLLNSTSEDTKLGECDVILERVVFDDRIMAIVVRLLDETDTWTCVNRVPHITVGTRDKSVRPKESNDLLARWLEVGSGNDTGIGERVIEGRPTLKGTVRGVLSKRRG